MPLPEFKLEAYFSRWEFTARYHLSASDAQTLSLSELLALAGDEDRARWATLALGYIESRGTPELRTAIARTYAQARAEHVIAFAGAEEGLYCAIDALLAPGDHAIVTSPNYQSMETLARTAASADAIALRPEDGWQIDVDELAGLVRPNTRLIALNFPNNPTGAIATPERFEAVVALCRKHGLWLLCDEVYRGIERDERKRLPQAFDAYERGLSLNGVAKAHGLPGLRVGWIACRDEAALARMERLKHYLSICNAGPSELLATVAVKASDALFARTRALCERNLQTLRRFFARHAERFAWYEPDGGCIAFPQYRGAEGAQRFCTELVEKTGVLLLPPSVYASDLADVPQDRFRVGYGRAGIEEPLEVLERYLTARR